MVGVLFILVEERLLSNVVWFSLFFPFFRLSGVVGFFFGGVVFFEEVCLRSFFFLRFFGAFSFFHGCPVSTPCSVPLPAAGSCLELTTVFFLVCLSAV